MIEELTAKDGSPILKVDGLGICSPQYPRKEASDWARKAKVGRASRLIVLGAGCGYHLSALKERFPERDILSIESNSEIYAWVNRRYGVNAEFETYLFRNLTELGNRSTVRRFLTGPYQLLVYFPVTRLEPEVYGKIQAFLTGRSEKGFLNLCGLREEFSDFSKVRVAGAAKLRPLSVDQMLSMGDIKKWESNELNEKNWEHQFLLKAIGELIA